MLAALGETMQQYHVGVRNNVGGALDVIDEVSQRLDRKRLELMHVVCGKL